jgi:hypothetical protein
VDEQLDESGYYYQQDYYKRNRKFKDPRPKQLPTERQEEVAIVN